MLLQRYGGEMRLLERERKVCVFAYLETLGLDDVMINR